jgi:hypothetical protein
VQRERVATDQDETIDPEVAAVALDALTRVTPITQAVRDAGAFGAEQSVPPSAPVADRLLAFCGRAPHPRG